MARSGDISFELERFEWVSADRLEVEGRRHGVRRRLRRAWRGADVEGQRRGLRALPDAGPASAERWVAAFPWEGDVPVLPGAELELGRGIVVDLPRLRRSKARGAAAVAAGPTGPIQASTRHERDAVPGREEAERLLAALTASRAAGGGAPPRRPRRLARGGRGGRREGGGSGGRGRGPAGRGRHRARRRRRVARPRRGGGGRAPHGPGPRRS